VAFYFFARLKQHLTVGFIGQKFELMDDDGVDSLIRHLLRPGLPDGLFLNQKVQIWVNLRGPLNGKCW
jgi:hypothetical protein